MKRARFSKEQIIQILRANEAGEDAGELTRKHCVCKGTFDAWKAKFDDISMSETQWLKALEDENRRLKSLLDDAMQDKAARGWETTLQLLVAVRPALMRRRDLEQEPPLTALP